MWFVSKKEYNAMVAERDKWKQIAEKAVDLSEQIDADRNEWMKIAIDVQNDNRILVAHEEEMLAAFKQLEKQRDMWRERAEEENRQAETYRGMLKCAEVG